MTCRHLWGIREAGLWCEESRLDGGHHGALGHKTALTVRTLTAQDSREHLLGTARGVCLEKVMWKTAGWWAAP